jgi:phage tail sheath gpL-like
MTIAFQNIPGNIRVPFFYGEVSAGLQGFQQQSILLLIGLANPTGGPNPGTAKLDQPVQVFANEDFLFGVDSPLAAMVKMARTNAPFQAIAGMAVTPAASPTKATGTFTITGTAARAASANVYVNGVEERFTIAGGDTPTNIATKLAAAINADPYCPVTAAAAVGVVTCTANVGGTWGNQITLAVGILSDDDPLAASMIVASPMTGGAGDPALTTGLANLGDVAYDYIGSMFSDSGNVTALENFLSDIVGRWGPYSQVYGHAFWGKDESFGALATEGQLHNSPHCTFVGSFNYITPPYLNVAVTAAIAAFHLTTFPEGSAPLQTLPKIGVKGPVLVSDRSTVAERQSLYFDGVSMDRFDDFTGECQFDRTLTTYQHNQWGSPDATFLDINTPLQVMYALRRLRADLTQNLGRVALADSNPYNVSNIVTVQDIINQAIHTYTRLVKDGCMENADLFAANVQGERDANDATRVNLSLPLDTVNQLRIVAVAAVVYLQNPVAGRVS